MSSPTPTHGFGTIKGVFIPSILTILGVVLFLRLGWVVGQAGLTSTLIIILLSSLITFITALSISTRATDSQIGTGGSYFLISRCFGIEPGAAVGIPLYLAQALGISFYSVGFAESLKLFFPDISIPLVAFATLVGLTVLTFISSSLALKMQSLILMAIILALLSFWLGSPLESTQLTATSPDTNLGFWEIFAVFFPAVTGIEAGISMSGDLKDPRKSLPVGTIAAVIVGALVYMFCAFMFSQLAPTDLLISNSLIMTEIAVISILIFIGLWGATLSSAVGALLGAPRTLQALAIDRIVPSFLAKGTKETNEPRIATVFSFFIASAGILLGDLNTIASILSMFFLTSYGALNLVSALEGLIDNPSWRPSFRIPWFISLTGAVLCFGVMFMINSGYSFIALTATVLIYFYMKKKKVKSNYSDIRSGLILHLTRYFIYKLNTLKFDARNWRPNFLIFSGSPKSRFHLIRLADAINHKRGFMTVATIILKNKVNKEHMFSLEASMRNFLSKNKISALSKVIEASAFAEGAGQLMESYGLGIVKPNSIILGDTSNPEQISSHAKIIRQASEENKNILIIKDGPTTEIDSSTGGRSIDVWWKGKEGNADLMLTLAYMLKTSAQWRNAKLTLKTIVFDDDEKEGVSKNISQFLKNSRVPADYEIYTSDKNSVFPLIIEKSKNSDIVFLGLKKPDDEEDYTQYYNNFINQPTTLKTVIFVLANEKISFMEIFS